MYRSIRILWWCRRDIPVHHVFLVQVIPEVVLCRSAYAIHCVWIVCLSSSSAILFNPSTSAIADHSKSAKDIDTYFKSQLYVEDTGSPAVNEIRAYNLVIDDLCLTTRSLPLLADLKGLSGNGISLDSQTRWRSFPIYQHLQMLLVYTIFFVFNAKSQQLLQWKSTRNIWSHVFGQQWAMIAVMIDTFTEIHFKEHSYVERIT